MERISMKSKYVEFMKAQKKYKVIFGIVAGLALHFGMEPGVMRKLLVAIALLLLLLDITGFVAMVLGYITLYFLVPEYDSALDLECNPNADEHFWT